MECNTRGCRVECIACNLVWLVQLVCTFNACDRCQLNGFGCEKDIVNALPVIEDAMHKGSTRARTTFAVCLVHGIGVIKSSELAMPLLRQSADEGHGKAISNLVALLQDTDFPKSELHR